MEMGGVSPLAIAFWHVADFEMQTRHLILLRPLFNYLLRVRTENAAFNVSEAGREWFLWLARRPLPQKCPLSAGHNPQPGAAGLSELICECQK